MIPAERRQLITDLVSQYGAMSVAHLAERTGASAVTIRRDLDELADRGLLARRHGGAIAPGFETLEASYAEKSHVAADAKAAIAVSAAALVQPGDSVILGAGSTTEALARELWSISDLTVVTNSLLVAHVLASAPQVSVRLTGGDLRGATFALVGPATVASLAGIRARTVFLSGNGVSAARGLSTPDAAAASVDQALVAAAQRIVVLADHTKIGVDALIQTVSPDRIDVLITDSAAAARALDEISCAGIGVTVAPQKLGHQD